MMLNYFNIWRWFKEPDIEEIKRISEEARIKREAKENVVEYNLVLENIRYKAKKGYKQLYIMISYREVVEKLVEKGYKVERAVNGPTCRISWE